MKHSMIVASLLLAATAAMAQTATRGLEIKYVRDSAEYATLTREVYRVAGRMATAAGKSVKGPWGVILDVDETTLDNSQYQIDRGIYGLDYESASWAEWMQREQAGSVPGVKQFLDAVRAAGGRVIFITDREAMATTPSGTKVDGTKATRENLDRNQLWNSADLLCLKTQSSDTKDVRRKSVATGTGPCSWSGTAVTIVAFVGDQMTDFPQPPESSIFPMAGKDDAFGTSLFLLPQPMYGKWVSAVTRESGAFQ